MKAMNSTIVLYPELRRRFKNSQDIADSINRSSNYVKLRMTTTSGKDFTDREKKILGLENGGN